MYNIVVLLFCKDKDWCSKEREDVIFFSCIIHESGGLKVPCLFKNLLHEVTNVVSIQLCLQFDILAFHFDYCFFHLLGDESGKGLA